MTPNLSADDKMNWINGMRDMTHCGDHIIRYAEGFAGTHLTEFILSANAEAINDEFGENFQYECVACAECDEQTSAFIADNARVELLVEFTKELGAATARDLRTKLIQVVPDFELFLFGFSCVSRASNNSNAHENLGCVQDGVEKTGETLNEVMLVVLRKRSRKCYGENLKALDAKTPDHEFASDADYIKDFFKEAGYWVDTFIVRGECYGSCASRCRWLLYAMRSDVK
jgi:site-specific DNA-cytosine methylase